MAVRGCALRARPFTALRWKRLAYIAASRRTRSVDALDLAGVLTRSSRLAGGCGGRTPRATMSPVASPRLQL